MYKSESSFAKSDSFSKVLQLITNRGLGNVETVDKIITITATYANMQIIKSLIESKDAK